MRVSTSMVAIVALAACARQDAPPPAEAVPLAIEERYVGVKRCGECHDAAFAFWNNTRHARAFFTLASRNKHIDRACIGCHVTGFERAGGHHGAEPRGLEAVQCEVCHGPGARHAETQSLGAIVKTPERELCRSCHQPPQVPDDWDLDAAWLKTLGPGHGQAL
jgi:hypothetical protein